MATLFRAAITSASTVTTPQSFDVASETRTPLAGIYELTATTTTGTLIDGARYGCGITDGTTQRAMGVQMEDGVAGNNADCELRQDTASIIQFCNAASSARNAELQWASWHAAGSAGNWTDFPGNAFKVVSIYALDGNWAVVELAGNATSGQTATVSGLSFAPDFVRGLSHFGAYSSSTGFSNARVAMGYAIKTPTGAIQQFAFTDYEVDSGLPTSSATDLRDDCFISKHDQATDGGQLELTAWTSDGLTVTTRRSSESVSVALLIGRTGRQMWCGIPTSIDTSSASAQTVTEPGFAPEGYFLVATDLSTKNSKDTGAGSGKWSSGIYTGTESACCGVQVEDNVATSDTRCITDSIVAHVLDDAAGVSWKASHSAMASNGPTLSIDDASAANRVFGMVCWGGSILVAPAETVGISDASLILKSALHSGETVGITDAQVIIDSALHSSETVGIADGTVLVTSVLRSDETVAIQDASVIVTSALESDETVGITETTALVTSVFRSDETMGITDATVIVFSALESDETVSIQDQALLVTSSLQNSETVAITEEIEFFTALEANETVSILDASVLVTATDMGALIANETVGITDAQLFTSYIRDDETVGILDNALLVFTTLQIDETETILDGAALAGTGTEATANETVGITDASQFVFGRILQNSETVGILDGLSFGVGLIPGRAGPGRGRTVEGGAERGSTIDGGSVKGGTL